MGKSGRSRGELLASSETPWGTYAKDRGSLLSGSARPLVWPIHTFQVEGYARNNKTGKITDIQGKKSPCDNALATLLSTPIVFELPSVGPDLISAYNETHCNRVQSRYRHSAAFFLLLAYLSRRRARSLRDGWDGKPPGRHPGTVPTVTQTAGLVGGEVAQHVGAGH